MRNESAAPPVSAPHRQVASFEDLIAWQKARSLTRAITELTGKPAVSRKFAFRDQIERAAVSVMSNIAEGYERGSRAEFHHMLSISKGSCEEVRSLLYVALDAGYVPEAQFQALMGHATETARVIGALRASVGRQRDENKAAL